MIAKNKNFSIINGNENYNLRESLHGNGFLPRYYFNKSEKYKKDGIRNARVLVYLDDSALEEPKDSTMYLANNLAKDDFFQVNISTKYDPNLTKNADIVIPRFDPPLNYEFLKELENYDNGERLFINKPKAQRYFSNKKYLEDIANYEPELLPETIITNDPVKIAKFMDKLEKKGKKHIVYKPNYGFGGNGIEKLTINDKSYNNLINHVKNLYDNEIILQDFIEGIGNCGDKRIHIIDGKPTGAVLRMPKKGEFRANVKQGATKYKSEITDEDYGILDKILPILKDKEVYWAGIDIIGPYLGEINAISPGLLYSVDELNGNIDGNENVVSNFSDQIKSYIKKLKLK